MKRVLILVAQAAGLAAVIWLSACQRDNLIAPAPARESPLLFAKQTPEVPDTIKVPDGNHLQFAAYAVGVQIYQVRATATGGFGWVFLAPEATLYEGRNGVVGRHYAGPTWETNSGSKVVGARISSAPSTNPHSIPQLLLRAVSSQGPGVLHAITYIQRLNTSGGVAPASGADSTHLGDTARVPYTASYYFYAGHE